MKIRRRRLRRIGLGAELATTVDVEALLSGCESMPLKLTHLSINTIHLPGSSLLALFRLCPQLTSLWLKHIDDQLLSLLWLLVYLPRLDTLTLGCNYTAPFRNPWNLFARDCFPSLPSVRVLHIELNHIECHYWLSCQFFGNMFPNLKM